MQKNMVVLFLLVFTLCSTTSFADSIRFAPLPMLSKTEVENSFLPFAHYLSASTSSDVELVYHKSYQELIDGLLTDQIDLAYLGPLPYVLLTQHDSSFVPVVRFVDPDGRTTYTCSLVAFDSTLSNLKDAISPLVALTQAYSTCGFFGTEQLLQRSGVTLHSLPYYYAGQHSECALDVVRDKAQFAGIKSSIAQQYQSLGLKIIAQSDPMPGFLLVANPRTLDANLILHIQKTILNLNPLGSSADATTTARWGRMIRYGAAPVSSSDYDIIREALARINVPEGDL